MGYQVWKNGEPVSDYVISVDTIDLEGIEHHNEYRQRDPLFKHKTNYYNVYGQRMHPNGNPNEY